MTDISIQQEAIIPKFVWDFAKKVLKNPIAAGILALIVWNYIKNKSRKKESISEDNTMSNSGALLTKKIIKKEIQKPAKEEDVCPKELAMGIKVEMEHTDDKAEAKKIALQHLAENPKYYTLLKKHVEEKAFFDKLSRFKELNGWKDIGGNPTKNKVKRWQKGDKTAYITKKEWEKKTDYAFGVNKDVFKASWNEDLQEVIKFANNYMRKN